jgi:hypothetical protein
LHSRDRQPVESVRFYKKIHFCADNNHLPDFILRFTCQPLFFALLTCPENRGHHHGDFRHHRPDQPAGLNAAIRACTGPAAHTGRSLAAIADELAERGQDLSRNLTSIRGVSDETVSGMRQAADAVSDLTRRTGELESLIECLRNSQEAECAHDATPSRSLPARG